MHNLIQEGAPVITGLAHTDEPGLSARALCLVDGFAAEIMHEINTRRQEYNRHTLSLFDYSRMEWVVILNWSFPEAGHVPLHPDSETLGYLSGLTESMWARANVIVNQSRLRQQEIEVQHYAAQRMEHQVERDAYLIERHARAEGVRPSDNDDAYPAVERGELITPEGLDELHTLLEWDE